MVREALGDRRFRVIYAVYAGGPSRGGRRQRQRSCAVSPALSGVALGRGVPAQPELLLSGGSGGALGCVSLDRAASPRWSAHAIQFHCDDEQLTDSAHRQRPVPGARGVVGEWPPATCDGQMRTPTAHCPRRQSPVRPKAHDARLLTACAAATASPAAQVATGRGN